MEPKQREQLMFFLENLPCEVRNSLAGKELNPLITLDELCAGRVFALYEVSFICEGVRRVFSGEDSPSNFRAFVSQDPNIEEDNRPKIPELCYEIQQKLFDPVLPILKEAGFPIKEGRVPEPPGAPVPIKRSESAGAPTPPPAPVVSPFAPQSSHVSPIGPISPMGQGAGSREPEPAIAGAALDERHLRALIRIASGTKHPEQELREKFEDLPEGLKRAITSVDTANALQEISKKHLLHVDQMGALASETGLVLLGITHPVYFVTNLTTRLNVPQQKALEVARDVSAQILAKVKDALRNLHEAGRTGSAVQTPRTEQTSHPNTKTQDTPDVPLATSATPYSKEAAWDTGVSQGLAQSRARLEKETPPPPHYASEAPKTPPAPPHANRPGQVGPTGWKPAPDGNGSNQTPITKQTPSFTLQTQSPIPPISKPPPSPQPPAPPFPPRPPRERTVFSPRPMTAPPETTAPPRPEEPDDFLSEKLAKPAGLPSETERYAVDPYREPPE